MKLFWTLFMIFGLTRSIQYNTQHNCLRKNYIKVIVFTKKTVPKNLESIKKTSINNVNNILYKLNEYVFHYTTLSEEDRYLIETILDLLL